MGQLLLLLVVALTVAVVVFGVTVLVSGNDPGLAPAEPDGRAVPLPADRPLREADLTALRFDTAVRGYRMAQVDQALRRAAYDIGYKDELVSVLEAEVTALREGRTDDADVLRRAREAALDSSVAGLRPSGRETPDGPRTIEDADAAPSEPASADSAPPDPAPAEPAGTRSPAPDGGPRTRPAAPDNGARSAGPDPDAAVRPATEGPVDGPAPATDPVPAGSGDEVGADRR